MSSKFVKKIKKIIRINKKCGKFVKKKRRKCSKFVKKIQKIIRINKKCGKFVKIHAVNL